MMAGAHGLSPSGAGAEGEFTTGDVVLVNTLLAQLFRPLDMLGWVYRTIRQGLIDMEAMFGMIDTPAEVAGRAGRARARTSMPAMSASRMSISPMIPSAPILKGIDLDVPPGTMLAVVGPSGAGKSTLSRLLFRFYEPTGGRITIDGQDITQVTQASLRAAIGIVPQDTVLFNDTIGYNIGYGREGASQAEIEEAARGAAIHDFIARSARRLRGAGRRARAQAFGRREAARRDRAHPAQGPADPDPRRGDQRARQPHRGGDPGDAAATSPRAAPASSSPTACRPIVDADQIVVLDQGRVAERGTHAQLLRKNGLYAEMWIRQQSESDDEAEAAESSLASRGANG